MPSKRKYAMVYYLDFKKDLTEMKVDLVLCNTGGDPDTTYIYIRENDLISEKKVKKIRGVNEIIRNKKEDTFKVFKTFFSFNQIMDKLLNLNVDANMDF
ncbi:MAG: hypothetical protein WDK96_01040 [Candidatus Paceibacterota bacterium]|jgi:hypothetical protein